MKDIIGTIRKFEYRLILDSISVSMWHFLRIMVVGYCRKMSLSLEDDAEVLRVVSAV